MKSVQEQVEVVEQYIGTECEARRLWAHCYRQVHVSHFGVIPKSEPEK